MHFYTWDLDYGSVAEIQHAARHPALVTRLTAMPGSNIATRSGNFRALSPACRGQARHWCFNRQRRVKDYFTRTGDCLRPAVVALMGKAMYCLALA
jgi:hypothetical protein